MNPQTKFPNPLRFFQGFYFYFGNIFSVLPDELDGVHFVVVVVRRFHAIKYSSLLSIVSARVESTGS